MANMSKLKRRGTLGTPPSVKEASNNLEQPEIAPAPEINLTDSTATYTSANKTATIEPKQGGNSIEPPVIDGRTLRRKGRTVQFNARVTPEFHQRIFRLVAIEDRPAVDILEDMLSLYETKADD